MHSVFDDMKTLCRNFCPEDLKKIEAQYSLQRTRATGPGDEGEVEEEEEEEEEEVEEVEEDEEEVKEEKEVKGEKEAGEG
jgi:Ran GTPase-activating protein (RanGAP) involved in mRNA processing and transport